MMKSYTYLSEVIEPCERATGEHRGRWIIQQRHHSGMLIADEFSPHYRTLEAARESIRENARHRRSTSS